MSNRGVKLISYRWIKNMTNPDSSGFIRLCYLIMIIIIIIIIIIIVKVEIYFIKKSNTNLIVKYLIKPETT
ncbi:MAG: hypothetical protein N7Q72_06340, partial [Spiroplasma sp. Tabriz.8]|nr:hypothetical protein [Spiroplasma sp. Tabriz.8]